jgi:hypothetical protein
LLVQAAEYLYTTEVLWRLSTSLVRKLMREGSCPAAVTQWMDLHPDSVLPFVQLQSARTAWHPKVPMMAAGSPRQLAFASNDQSAPAARLEDLTGGEFEGEFKQCGL